VQYLFGAKSGFESTLDSIYEAHFAHLSLERTNMLPIDQHLWLELEQEYTLGIILNIKQNLCDFMQPKRKKEDVYKIIANCYTRENHYKINQEFSLYFQPISAIKSIAHTEISYWANGKKLPIKDGFGDLGNRLKSNNIDTEIRLEDTITKTKRSSNNWFHY
jgi:hypothetical protein